MAPTRIDLLALSTQDLEALSNRGTVKKSQREIDEGEIELELTEDDAGNITVKSSENITTVLKVDKILRDCPCSCAAIGMCRHIIRAVLAYQRKNESPAVARDLADSAPPPGMVAETAMAIVPPNSSLSPSPSLTAAPPPIPSASGIAYSLEPWDPGAVSDQDMEKTIGATLLARAEKLFKDGQIVEVARGTKPFARFHTLSHSIRFMVPYDLRYARCDCATPSPCIHVPLVGLSIFLRPD